MKRLAISLADLAARDNLASAAWKAARGKAQRPGVAAFLADADARLASLAGRILDGSAPLGQVRQFTIQDCPRRSKSDPPCRSNIDPGMGADRVAANCG